MMEKYKRHHPNETPFGFLTMSFLGCEMVFLKAHFVEKVYTSSLSRNETRSRGITLRKRILILQPLVFEEKGSAKFVVR